MAVRARGGLAGPQPLLSISGVMEKLQRLALTPRPVDAWLCVTPLRDVFCRR